MTDHNDPEGLIAKLEESVRQAEAVQQSEDKYRKPWTCDHCKQFMYSLDENGHPTEGAPKPLYVNIHFQKCCRMCFGMSTAIGDNDYMKKLQHDMRIQMDKKKKLGSGGEYFPGDS